MSTIEMFPTEAPPRTLVKYEPWRLNPKQNTEVVTVFSYSPTSLCVKASTGLLGSISDGPYACHARHVEVATVSGRNALMRTGGEWPYWMVVVRTDCTNARFPRHPEAFDDWFGDWVRDNGLTVLSDWRAAARKDGCAEFWRWPARTPASLHDGSSQQVVASASEPAVPMRPHFDYASLDAHSAAQLRRAADEIRGHVANQLASVVEAGKRLLAAKELLPHGAFGKWIEATWCRICR